jgi:hypothetical protein
MLTNIKFLSFQTCRKIIEINYYLIFPERKKGKKVKIPPIEYLDDQNVTLRPRLKNKHPISIELKFCMENNSEKSREPLFILPDTNKN